MNFLNLFKFLLFIIIIFSFPISSFAKANFNEIVQQVSKEAKKKGISSKIINEFKNKTKFIGTNVGMTDIIRPALYSAVHPIHFNDNNKTKELVTVVGPICESGDVLVRNLLVDNNLKIGDPMIVENTGAYGFVMASNYNNRKLPEEVLVG